MISRRNPPGSDSAGVRGGSTAELRALDGVRSVLDGVRPLPGRGDEPVAAVEELQVAERHEAQHHERHQDFEQVSPRCS